MCYSICKSISKWIFETYFWIKEKLIIFQQWRIVKTKFCTISQDWIVIFYSNYFWTTGTVLYYIRDKHKQKLK
jgi:hypothetical protein